MMTFYALLREIKFAVRDRSILVCLTLVFILSAVSVWSGLVEVDRQKMVIENLIKLDQQDRYSESAKVKDWGSAAYYSFHLTYEPPSDFAYAAMGLRDVQPWKHRIRMLALEGQIYERDVGNPSIALVGRFDFSFLVAFIIPLTIIMLLYDLRTSERTAGRHDLLEATIGQPFSFWLLRAALRVGALFLCLIVPLIISGLIEGTTASKLILASLIVFAYLVFWAFICFLLSAWRRPGSVILVTLITIWISTAVILPAAARVIIDRFEPVPTGAEILLLQRETVNDAWDLPKTATMNPFFDRHPEWLGYEPKADIFDWPWYYAFQQVGDQRTEQLSNAYRKGRLRRDRIAAWASLIAPPSFIERALQSLAATDLKSTLRYEEKVRVYHSTLRSFYYPKLYRHAPFDKALLGNLPEFQSTQQ